MEKATDLRVALPGRDFVFARNYSSYFGGVDASFEYSFNADNITGDGSGFVFGKVGTHWMANTSLYVRWRPGNPLPAAWEIGGGAREEVLFTETSSGSGVFRPRGRTSQILVEGTRDVDGNGTNEQVLILQEPGSWAVEFLKPDTASGALESVEGLIVARSDAYGNTHKYEYDAGDNLVDRILLNGTDAVDATGAGTDPADAEVEFYWHTGAGTLEGYLYRVEVRRLIGGSAVTTQFVEYTYGHDLIERHNDTMDPFTMSDDIVGDPTGTPSEKSERCLVQVVKGTRVDEVTSSRSTAAGGPYHVEITQYRYHDGGDGSNETGFPSNFFPSDPQDADGFDFQLKAVFPSEQIEFLAQALNADATSSGGAEPSGSLGGIGEAIYEAAEDLLGYDDNQTVAALGTGAKALDLASKVISYRKEDISGIADKLVGVEWIKASCGCAGGNGGGGDWSRMEFEFGTHSGAGTGPGLSSLPTSSEGKTIKISEYDGVSGTAPVYREHTIELVYPFGTAGAPYAVARATTDPVTGQEWVRWIDHDFVQVGTSSVWKPGDTLTVYEPSATSSYTPGATGTSSTAVSYSAKTDGGLVRRFTYNGDRYITEVEVGTISSSSLSMWPIIRHTFPTSNSTSARTYFPSKTERSRIEGPWPASADDIETVLYEYDFADSTTTVLRQHTIKEERALESENGPSGSGLTVERHYLFNAEGEIEWMIAEDGCPTYQEYDDTTGVLTQIVRNADMTGSGEAPAFTPGTYGLGITPGGWGQKTGGELVTEWTRDALGRTTSIVNPGGVTSYVRRSSSANSERVGTAYLTVTRLPHKLAGTSPIEFDGPVTRTWMNAGGGSIRSGDYAIDGSATYTPLTGAFTLSTELARSAVIHDLHGQATARRRWTDIAGVTNSNVEVYSEWTSTFDTFGRLIEAKDPLGTVESFTYDAMDRPITRSIGDGVDQTKTHDYVYDSGGTSTQGAGNGNLTYIKMYTAEPTSGGLSAAERVVVRTFDFRDRLVFEQQPTAPHTQYEYDALNRITRTSVYTAVPTTIPSTSATDRVALTEASYSQRNIRFRERVAIDPSLSSPSYLENHRWIDLKGRVIAAWDHSGPAIKYVYDGLDRVTASYTTDRAGDDQPGAAGNLADAGSLTGDTVLEQVAYAYEPTTNGNLLSLVTSRVRSHDSSAIGALASGDGVTSFMGFYYDDANRRTHSANIGTNQTLFETGGTAPTWPPGSAPVSSDTQLVTATTFDERGKVATVTSPGGDVTKYLYDDAGRTIATIEAYDDAALDTIAYASGRWQFVNLDGDEDRVTSYVYDKADNVTKLVAHLPDGSGDDAQITQYHYDVDGTFTSPGVTDSLADLPSMLQRVSYPDETTGEPGSTNYEVEYSYNALGELRSVTDQNGTVHVYERDSLGRVTADRINTFATGIDQTIARIEFAYDSSGRIERVTSEDSATGGTVENEVKYEYDSLWRVVEYHQDTNGEAYTDGSNGSQTIEYAYSDSAFSSSASVSTAHNYARMTEIVYPSDTSADPTVEYRYGSSGSASDLISRVQGFDINGSGGAVDSEYIGLGRVASVDYGLPDVQLDRTFSHEGKRNTGSYSSQAAGVYPGFDRFGRPRIHAWVDGELDEKKASQGTDPDTTVPGIPPLIEQLHTYDRDSNRTAKLDARPGAQRPDRDARYSYDALDRLGSTLKGGWDDPYSPTTWTDTNQSEGWTYDVLGNWEELLTDGNADGDFDDTGAGASYVDLAETRDHNMANELLDIDEDQTVSGVDLSYLHDHAGNRTRETYASGTYDQYLYDAWNRLTKVTRITDNGQTQITSVLSTNDYNGLHHRVVETDGYGGNASELFYSPGWQLLEELYKPVQVLGETQDPDVETQYFWGLRYVDDIVMHRRREVPSTSWASDDTFFHLTDPMFSTEAIVDGTAAVRERVWYTSYGTPNGYREGDVNADGTMTTAEFYAYYPTGGADIGDADYCVELDLNRDGANSPIDFNPPWTQEASKPALGENALGGGDVSNRLGFGGYIWGRQISMYHVRHRSYDPRTGRWLQRDPLGPIDGLNLYNFVGGSPTVATDPSGLKLTVRDRRDEVEDILNTMCSGVTVDGETGEVIMPDTCEDSDACKCLAQLVDSDNNHTIWTPNRLDPDHDLDDEELEEFHKNLERYPGTNIPIPASPKKWETLWPPGNPAPGRLRDDGSPGTPSDTWITFPTVPSIIRAPGQEPREYESDAAMFHELCGHARYIDNGTHPPGIGHPVPAVDDENEYRKRRGYPPRPREDGEWNITPGG